MRIAVFPSAYHPSVGGVEEMSRRLGQELTARGHTLAVWTGRPDEAVPALHVVDGVPVRRSSLPAPRMAPLPALRWVREGGAELRRLLREVQRFEPDLLHVHCFSTNGVYAAAVARLTGLPLVITLHGETVMDDRDIFDRSVFLRQSLRAALRQASAVTACSRFTLDDAVDRFGLQAGSGRVIHNGVDLDETAEEPLQVPHERFVLAIGRVVEKKGFDLLLDAWSRVQARHPDVGLVLGGSGPQEPLLRELVAQEGLRGRVVLAGRLTRPQVAWAMRRSEVFVMPSRVEPFGIVALEAWRAGTAVLASCRGGAPEFVRHAQDGLLADPLDAGELAAALDLLLSDGALRRRLAEAGRERVRGFSWTSVADEYLSVYEGAADAPSGPPR